MKIRKKRIKKRISFFFLHVKRKTKKKKRKDEKEKDEKYEKWLSCNVINGQQSCCPKKKNRQQSYILTS